MHFLRRMREGLPHEDYQDKMMNIAVFASGRGTNFSAIARAVRKGMIKARLVLLVCDQPGAVVLARARRYKVKVALVKREDFKNKGDFESRIIRHLRDNKVELVVLAGYMRMLSKGFIERYKNKIINIHPSILPAFKGTESIGDAFEYGSKLTGVTVHFVDEEMDHGPIILQGGVEIRESDTAESLEARIHKLEHKLYPKAIGLYLSGKLKVSGRKVRIST